jgi:dihydrofolate reductase
MRQLRYSVAASLDGYIAGPNGEYDWIPMDPEIDFKAMYAGFSALVMGRRSYDVFAATGSSFGFGEGMPAYVYSRTLPEGHRGGATFAHDAAAHMRGLKEADGKPIWLCEVANEAAKYGITPEAAKRLIKSFGRLKNGLPEDEIDEN